jgi:hypothetical protein
VTWRPAPLAAYYEVGVVDTLGGNRSYELAGRRRSLTIPNVARTTGLRVKIFAFSRRGLRSPAAKAVLKGEKGKHR